MNSQESRSFSPIKNKFSTLLHSRCHLNTSSGHSPAEASQKDKLDIQGTLKPKPTQFHNRQSLIKNLLISEPIFKSTTNLSLPDMKPLAQPLLHHNLRSEDQEDCLYYNICPPGSYLKAHSPQIPVPNHSFVDVELSNLTK